MEVVSFLTALIALLLSGYITFQVVSIKKQVTKLVANQKKLVQKNSEKLGQPEYIQRKEKKRAEVQLDIHAGNLMISNIGDSQAKNISLNVRVLDSKLPPLSDKQLRTKFPITKLPAHGIIEHPLTINGNHSFHFLLKCYWENLDYSRGEAEYLYKL